MFKLDASLVDSKRIIFGLFGRNLDGGEEGTGYSQERVGEGGRWQSESMVVGGKKWGERVRVSSLRRCRERSGVGGESAPPVSLIELQPHPLVLCL